MGAACSPREVGPEAAGSACSEAAPRSCRSCDVIEEPEWEYVNDAEEEDSTGDEGDSSDGDEEQETEPSGHHEQRPYMVVALPPGHVILSRTQGAPPAPHAASARAPGAVPLGFQPRPFPAGGRLPALPLSLAQPLAQPSPAPLGASPTQTAGRVQESDLLERYPKGPNCLDELTNAVPLVSLGCYCGPKLSFQKMGRGAATLPFDWIRSTVDGLLHYIRTDFDGFYNFKTKLPVPGCKAMVMYRDHLHSFWHDDPEDPAMHEKYLRRIERFNQLDARSSPVLFVRTAVTTEELFQAAELVEVLVARFGKEARLLLILNFQEQTGGPAFVQGLPNLMVYYLTAEVHRKTNPEFTAPFAGPVRKALDWAVGREVEARHFDSLKAAREAADADSSGYNGLGGLDAFEGGYRPGASEGCGAGIGVQVVRCPLVKGGDPRVPIALN